LLDCAGSSSLSVCLSDVLRPNGDGAGPLVPAGGLSVWNFFFVCALSAVIGIATVVADQVSVWCMQDGFSC
jgi:hypothetical protein